MSIFRKDEKKNIIHTTEPRYRTKIFTGSDPERETEKKPAEKPAAVEDMKQKSLFELSQGAGDLDEPSEVRADEFPDGGELTDISAGTGNERPEKMEEIYSTRAKRVRFKSETPIEAEAQEKRKEEAKEELIRGKMEFDLIEPDAPEVRLEAEIAPDAVVADEIIEDVRVKTLKGLYVRDVDGIDISLDPNESVKEYEKRAADTARRDARRSEQLQKADAEEQPRAEVSVTKVPVYVHESKIEKMSLRVGRFTDVVENEYDEYLKSNDPTISKSYHAMMKNIKPRESLLLQLSKMAQKRKEENAARADSKKVFRENFDEEPVAKPKKKRSKAGRFFTVLFRAIGESFIRRTSEKERLSAQDYQSREDERYVMEEVRSNIRKLSFELLRISLVGAALLTLFVLERVQGENIFGGAFQNGAFIFCSANMLLLLLGAVFGRIYLYNGLRALKNLRGNSDTAMSLAFLACFLQSVISLFFSKSFVNGEMHLYGFVAVLGLIANTVGRLLMAVRVRDNFDFITSRSPAYAAKIYDDEETARRMVSGTTANKGIIAYQHITSFLSDFLKISYAPDPSEDATGKAAAITVVSSVFVTVAYGIIWKSVPGTVSALSVMLCIGVPFCALLAGNIPMLLFSKKMLKNNAMVAGYPSVRQFCDTSAVMVRADELFPKGAVRLEGIRTFQQFRVDDTLLAAAAVLREARSPIAQVFDELVREHEGELPRIESVLYEDKSGVVGWVGGERILIGNMALMSRYHITVPEDADEEKYRRRGIQTAYIAASGQLFAMAALEYTAAETVAESLRKAEESGVAFVVATTDPNVTADLIADEYKLFHRSVKVMPTGYAGVIEEVTSKAEETSRAYLATRGKFSSMLRAVSGCIGLRSNITMGIVIEIFALLLGVLLCATIALYTGVSRLSVVELLIYIGFWSAATIAAQLIRRP